MMVATPVVESRQDWTMALVDDDRHLRSSGWWRNILCMMLVWVGCQRQVSMYVRTAACSMCSVCALCVCALRSVCARRRVHESLKTRTLPPPKSKTAKRDHAAPPTSPPPNDPPIYHTKNTAVLQMDHSFNPVHHHRSDPFPVQQSVQTN